MYIASSITVWEALIGNADGLGVQVSMYEYIRRC